MLVGQHPKALTSLPSRLAHFSRAVLRRHATELVWCGIEYEIRGPDDIQMLNNRPFTTDNVQPDETGLIPTARNCDSLGIPKSVKL
jgi:hypothetical protein